MLCVCNFAVVDERAYVLRASLRFVNSCTGIERATENKSHGEFPYVLNKASARDSRSRSARRTLRSCAFSPLASREKISCSRARRSTCSSNSNSSLVKILCCHCVRITIETHRSAVCDRCDQLIDCPFNAIVHIMICINETGTLL